MSTIDELTQPLTRAEVEDSIYAAIAARGSATTTWQPGATARTIIYGVAIVLSALSHLTALIAKSGFLEKSQGDWLTLVAKYVYDVERDQGTFATGSMVVDNAGGGVYVGGAGELVFLNPTTGKTYRNTGDYSISGLQTGVVIPVQAAELGAASTSAPGTISAFETPLLGLSCTNPGALVGRDAELDPALRAKCAAKTGSLSPNGPSDAYLYVMRTAEKGDGSLVGVTRARTIADGMGGVQVLVADGDGPINGADLPALQALVDTMVEPVSVTAIVANSIAVVVPVTYELWVRDTGAPDSTVQDLVDARLVQFFAAQPIGGVRLGGDPGKLFVSALEAVIGSAASDSERREVKVIVTAPVADVELEADEVAVIGTTTATIHQVAAGLI